MGYLMTATLLGSFKWMQDAPASWAQRAKDDFYAKVRRTDVFQTTPEIERGKEFERIICDNCNNSPEPLFMEIMKGIYVDKINTHPIYSLRPREEKERLLAYCLETCNTFYHQCKDGEQQVKVGKDIQVDNETFYLFGYIDVLKPTTILDLKTCTNYKESKYRDSLQHSIYQYCTGIKEFKYVVADYQGGDFPTACHIVETSVEEIEQAERKIKGRIRNLVHFLKENNLWEDYEQLFCRGKK